MIHVGLHVSNKMRCKVVEYERPVQIFEVQRVENYIIMVVVVS